MAVTVTDSPAIHALINAVEQADSPERLMGAVQALAAAQSEAGMPTLIAALGYNNPGAAAIAMQGLIQMGEAAVLPLLQLLDDYNYGARAWAIRALAAIADPRALDVLLSAAATDFAPSVRRAATKGVGRLRWFELSNEEVEAAQRRALETLLQVAEDADWSIRYAAVVGLQELAGALGQSNAAAILATLQALVTADPDLAVQVRSQWAIAILTQPAAELSALPISMHTPQ